MQLHQLTHVNYVDKFGLMIKARHFYKSSIDKRLRTFDAGSAVPKTVSFGMVSSVVLSSLLGATGAIAAEVDAAVVAVKPVVVAQAELKKPSDIRSFPAVGSAEVLLAVPEVLPVKAIIQTRLSANTGL